MSPRAMPVLLLLLLPGCRQLLEIPSDLVTLDGSGGGSDDAGSGGEGDGAPAVDAAPGQVDAGGVSCQSGTSSLFVGFDDPSELDDWTVELRKGCFMSVAEGQLLLEQTTPRGGVCRAFGDLSVDMLDQGVQVRIAQAGSDQMSLVFSLILSDGTDDVRARRRIRIERDEGQIQLSDCVGDSCPMSHGTLPIDPANQAWWRFDHDSADGSIHFEFATDLKDFTRPSAAFPVMGVTREQVRCVGVELGTYEGTDAGSAAFDDLLADEGPF